MAQPNLATNANSNSFSTSNLSTNDSKEYFHRSSLNNHGLITDNKKSAKMGSIKKWFARLGSSTNDINGEEKAHTDIEQRIANETKLQIRSISLLLLGAGGSGKSTVLKQMDRIHNAAKYEQDEKELQKTIAEVHKNIVSDIHDLCRYYYKLKQTHDLKFSSSDIENIVMQIASNNAIGSVLTLNMDFAQEIAQIWNTDTMKKVFEIRKKSHIMDNTPYFLNHVQKYADPQYVVTFDDYVRIRDRTTGIVTNSFRVAGKTGKEWIFNMTDVGGQRAERRKWIRVFSGIDVVLYVMSLSSYDQVLYEDHNTRCLDETLQLFEKTSGDKAFEKTDFIVFLNKNDIFQTKIKQIPFTAYKDDFDENKANDERSVIQWIQQEFVRRFDGDHVNDEIQNGIMNAQQKKKKKKRRAVHFHITCATDTKQIGAVVSYVQLELMRKLMSKAAIL